MAFPKLGEPPSGTFPQKFMASPRDANEARLGTVKADSRRDPWSDKQEKWHSSPCLAFIYRARALINDVAMIITYHSCRATAAVRDQPKPWISLSWAPELPASAPELVYAGQATKWRLAFPPPVTRSPRLHNFWHVTQTRSSNNPRCCTKSERPSPSSPTPRGSSRRGTLSPSSPAWWPYAGWASSTAPTCRS